MMTYRGEHSPSNCVLLNRFENALDWKFVKPNGKTSVMHVGPILSGEKLVDDPVFKLSLLKQFPHAIGGEMEGAGLCAVSGRVGAAWVLIKGICDWADGKKLKKYHPMASATAMSIVFYILNQKTALHSLMKPKTTER